MPSPYDYNPKNGPTPRGSTDSAESTPSEINESTGWSGGQAETSQQSQSTGGSGRKKKCTLKVIYYINGGDGDPPDTTTQIYNGPKVPVELHENAKDNEHGMTREGYYFVGWATSTSGALTYYPGDIISNSWTKSGSGTKTIKLYAKWVNTGVFIYDPGPKSIELYYASAPKANGTATTIKGAIFTRTGYTQIGWSTEQEYRGPIPLPSTDGSPVTWSDGIGTHIIQSVYGLEVEVTPSSAAIEVLYPIWQANSYSITVHANGGVGEDVVIPVTYDSEFTMPSSFNFVKNPYHVSILNEKADCTGPSWYLGWTYKYLRAANVELYAIWEGNEYTVTYTDGAGNVVHQSKATYGKPFYTDRVPYPESRIYNTFMGWKADDNTILTKQDVWFDAYSYGSDPTWTLSRDLTINRIWGENYSFGKIFFGGRYSDDYGIYVEEPPSYSWPRYSFTHKTIVGKNGDYLIDGRRYENVTKKYKISAYDGLDFYSVAKKVSAWLNQKKEGRDKYFRLEDSYEPDVYRLAVYEESNELENIFYKAGKCEIEFNCKPQRYLLSGDEYVLIEQSGQTITNPTDQNALPVIKMYGYGSVFINGKEISVLSNRNVITFDAETMRAVDNDGLNMNNLVFSYDNIYLKPGVNVITFDSTIFGVTIKPRWWLP